MPRVPGSQGPRQALDVLPNARIQGPSLTAPDVRLSAGRVSTPQYSVPQMRGGTLRGFRQDPNAIARPVLGGGQGRGLMEMGSALSSVGNALGDMALAMQAKVNATVVDDVVERARQKQLELTWGRKDEASGNIVGGYRQLKGEQAFRREDDKGLDDEVGTEFDEFVKGLNDEKLTNAAQREAFKQQTDNMAAQLRQGASVWSATQFDAYQTQVYTTAVESRTSAFALQDPGDRKGQLAALDEIDQAAYTLGKNRGDSAEAIELGMQVARSTAVESLFARVMSERKYDTAQAILNEYGEKVSPNSILKMKANLDGKVSLQIGEQVGASVWSGQAEPSFNPTDSDKLFNVVLTTENRGTPRQSADGKTITSPKGAYGAAQLMYGTAVETAEKLGSSVWKQFGLSSAKDMADLAKQPTKEGEAANRLIGQAYFNQQLNRFGGDAEKAMAAYNAGPGRVKGGWTDKNGNKHPGAVERAVAEGGQWQDYLPQETKDYLVYARKQMGNPQAGMPKRPSKSELYDQVYARTTDPDARRAAIAYIDKRWSAWEEDKRNTETSALETAYTLVDNTRDINSIPQEVWRNINPTQIDSLRSYAEKRTKNEPVETDWATFFIASQNPATLTPARMLELRPKLANEQFNKLDTMRREAQQPGAEKNPSTLNVSDINAALTLNLEARGEDATPEGKGKDAERARVGQLRSFLYDYVLQEQRTAGKRFTTGEVQDLVGKLFTQNVAWRKKVFGFDQTGTSPILTTDVNDILPADRKAVTDAFKARYKREPTEFELLGSYYRRRFFRQ